MLLATVGWVSRWNTARLHEALGYCAPAEIEMAYPDHQDTVPVESYTSERNPGRFSLPAEGSASREVHHCAGSSIL